MLQLSKPLPLLLIGSALAALLPLTLTVARNFEYEYLTLAAYLSLTILVGLGFLANKDATSDFKGRIGGAFLALGLMTLPGLLAFQAGLCPCSAQDFWFWWLVQLLPHAVLGQAGFVAILSLRRAGYSRLKCGLMLGFILLGLFLHLASTLWFHPQKRITHLLSGFIHGAIYDDWIPLDSGVLWARASHLMLGLLIWVLAALPKHRQRFLTCLLGIPLILATSWQASTYPSQTHGLQALNTLLPKTKAGRDFDFHYQEPKTDEEKRQIESLFVAAGFHVNDLSRLLMSYDKRVQIYLYPSHASKKLWFGGEKTDITDVVTPSIHITLENWPHSTLRHELVHAISSSFAYHGLGFHPNMAFTEGLAVALAPQAQDLSMHQAAARLLQSNLLPDVEQLFSPMFWGESGSRAYTLAGSIVQFLIERYGVLQVKLLYAGADWNQIFRDNQDTTLKLWRNFLETSYPSQKHAAGAEALFRYPGILNDRCPHSKATLSLTGTSAYLHWRQAAGWNVERDYWPWRQTLDTDPSISARLWRLQVQKLWVHFNPKDAASLLTTLHLKLKDKPEFVEDFDYTLAEVDLLIALNRQQEAQQKIQSLKDLLATYELGDGLTRQIWSRWLLLRDQDAAALSWLQLLSGRTKEVPLLASKKTSWIRRYLFLRNHTFAAHEQGLLIEAFEDPIPNDAPPSFRIEWFKSLALKWIELGQWKFAAKALHKAAEAAPAGQQAFLKLLWQEAVARDPRVH